MPELPEVETICRSLRILEGRRIDKASIACKALRAPIPPDLTKKIHGCTVDRVVRRGKYIVVRMVQGSVLVMHLGMSGYVTLDLDSNTVCKNRRHNHATFWFDDGRVLRFFDPRRFGLLDHVLHKNLGTYVRFRKMGPEPLARTFTWRVLASRLSNRNTSIKLALMNQEVVAGIGNIYASECLYWAGISPLTPASKVPPNKIRRLVLAIKKTLKRAIKLGGSSMQDFVHPSGELGSFQKQWDVFEKEGQQCPGCDCNQGIVKITQKGRSTYFCSKRQQT